MKQLDRITINPDVCLGQPTIRGMRITVSLLLKLVSNGMSTDEILAAYPELEKEDIDIVSQLEDELRKGIVVSVDDISARFRNLPITRESKER